MGDKPDLTLIGDWAKAHKDELPQEAEPPSETPETSLEAVHQDQEHQDFNINTTVHTELIQADSPIQDQINFSEVPHANQPNDTLSESSSGNLETANNPSSMDFQLPSWEEPKLENSTTPEVTVAESSPQALFHPSDQVASSVERLSIGEPKIDAAPAFSLFLKFSDKQAFTQRIEGVLNSDSYGVSFSDLKIQLESGRVLIPQISEYAAIHLFQQVRDVVDDLEFGLATESFSSHESSEDPFDNVFLTKDDLYLQQESAEDFLDFPKNPADIFITDLASIDGYSITKVFSTLQGYRSVSVSHDSDLSDLEFSFEKDLHDLKKELQQKAFDLGAHGVLEVKSYLSGRDDLQKRLWTQGTAVRLKKVL